MRATLDTRQMHVLRREQRAHQDCEHEDGCESERAEGPHGSHRPILCTERPARSNARANGVRGLATRVDTARSVQRLARHLHGHSSRARNRGMEVNILDGLWLSRACGRVHSNRASSRPYQLPGGPLHLPAPLHAGPVTLTCTCARTKLWRSWRDFDPYLSP